MDPLPPIGRVPDPNWIPQTPFWTPSPHIGGVLRRPPLPLSLAHIAPPPWGAEDVTLGSRRPPRGSWAGSIRLQVAQELHQVVHPPQPPAGQQLVAGGDGAALGQNHPEGQSGAQKDDGGGHGGAGRALHQAQGGGAAVRGGAGGVGGFEGGGQEAPMGREGGLGKVGKEGVGPGGEGGERKGLRGGGKKGGGVSALGDMGGSAGNGGRTSPL